MKKKLFSLVLCLLMCMTVLTGCNLFGTDLETYYNTVVATINYSYELNGETIEESENVTKRELITAYKSYGQDYVNNYGYTQQEAIETTLDTILNRKLMIKDVEVDAKRNNVALFNERETSYLWQSTYDAFYDNLLTYYNEVLGIEEDEESTDEEVTGVYNRYNPNAIYYTYTDSEGRLQYGVKKTTSVATVSGEYTPMYLDDVAYDYEYQKDGVYIFKELIYDTIKSYTTDTQWQSALNRYISTVRDNYSYVDFEDDDEVFYFELDRIYDIVRDNYCIEKYEEIYNRQAENGSDLTGVRVRNILEYYQGEVLSDYYTYVNDLTTFETDMLSTSTNVQYIPSSNTTNYFYVGVIELNFKTGQETPADLEEEVNSGKIDAGDENYQTRLNAIYNAVYADIKSETTGQSTGNRISAQSLLDEIKDLMDNEEYKYLDYNTVINNSQKVDEILADYGYSREGLTNSEIEEIVQKYVDAENQETEYARADEFIKYYYYYNDDTTFQNSDKTSVFGISSTGEVVYNDTFSDAQNDAFDEALTKLYNNGKGKIGDLSDLIRTDDGIYILFYAGEVETLFQGISYNFSLANDDIAKLGSTRVNIFNNKTYFDLVYDAIYEDNNFDNFETENLNYLFKTLTKGGDEGIITYYDEYKDLF